MPKSAVTLTQAAELIQHFHTVLRDYPPPEPAHLMHESPASLRIGEYLYALGYLTPDHIALAERSQRQALVIRPASFGQELVNRGIVHPDVLGVVLAVQLVDRLMGSSFRPRLLGEYLVTLGLLAPLQLATALQEQCRALAQHEPVLIGEVLLRQHAISLAALERGVYVQQTVERTRRERAAVPS